MLVQEPQSVSQEKIDKLVQEPQSVSQEKIDKSAVSRMFCSYSIIAL